MTPANDNSPVVAVIRQDAPGIATIELHGRTDLAVIERAPGENWVKREMGATA